MNSHRGNGAGRKAGEWKSVAAGRARIPRDLINGHGVSNVPSTQDVGSAAYRRMMHPSRRNGRRP